MEFLIYMLYNFILIFLINVHIPKCFVYIITFYQYCIPVSIMENFLPLLAFYITLFNTCFYHGLRMVEMTEIYLLNFNIVVYFNV